MSGAGESRLHPLFPQTSLSDTRSGERTGVSHISALDFVHGHHESPLRPQQPTRPIAFEAILVRDPPRERLAGSRASTEDDESPLARVTGKPEIRQQYPTSNITSTTAINPSEEFFADLYQLYYDTEQFVATTPKLKSPPIPLANPKGVAKSALMAKKGDENKLPTKKRRGSLQAIFVPSFFQAPLLSPTSVPSSPTKYASRIRALSAATPSAPVSPSTNTFASAALASVDCSSTTPVPALAAAAPVAPETHQRKRSTTISSFNFPRRSPPLDFLIDDDPFANLSAAPSATISRGGSMSSSRSGPSQLAGAATTTDASPLSASVPTQTPVIPVSSPRSPLPAPPPRTRPAYKRPAFASRPSLPSLDTLARVNVVLTKKVRKGRVGAGLPFEPWDLPSDDELLSAPASRPQTPAINANSNFNSMTITTTTTTASTSTSISTLAPSSSSVPLPILAPSERSDKNLHPASTSSRPSSPSAAGSTSTTPTMPASIAMHMPTPISMPPPITMPIVKPQPLLPSQILALGSVAEDVEMIIPFNSSPIPMLQPSASTSTSTSSLASDSQTPTSATAPWSTSSFGPAGFSTNDATYSWLAGPSSVSSFGDFAGEVDAELESVSSRPSSRAGLEGVGVKAEDGYLGGDFLDRYHQESRGGSEEGHGHLAADEEQDPNTRMSLSRSIGDVQNPEPQNKADNHVELEGKSEKHVDEGEDYSYLYQAPLNFDDVYTDSSNSNSSMPSGSIIFSSPPSSATRSLSRSLSLSSTSYSSVYSADSMDSASAVEDEQEQEEVQGAVFGASRRRNRRFADQNRSLSSLELDLEDGNGHSDLDGEREADIERDRESDERDNSTRSSSSHPSLSRTRSSSDDSDILLSPMTGDYNFFPYDQARALHRLQQQQRLHPYPHSHSGSALFAQQDAFGEDAERRVPLSSFHPEAESSSFGLPKEDAGVDWRHPFGVGEQTLEHQEQEDQVTGELPLPGVREGFGFGYDKVMLAAEVEDKTKSLATNTSIANPRTTTTFTTESEANLNSSSSSWDCHFFIPLSSSVDEHGQEPEQHQSDISSSSQPSPVQVPVTNLVSQTTPPQPDHWEGETMTSDWPAAHHTSSTMRTSFDVASAGGEPGDSSGWDGYRAHGHSSTSQSYRAGSSHGQASNCSGNALSSTYSSTSRSNHGRRRGNSDDEDEDERRRRRALEKMHLPNTTLKAASSSSSEDEEDEDDEDDETNRYGLPSVSSKTRLATPWSAPPASRSTSTTTESFVTAFSRSPSLKPMDFPSTSSNSSRYASEDDRIDDDDDDDVPLAQRIPGALTAQKSMRRQFHEEREQRKKEKTLRLETEAERRARQVTLRPAGAGGGVDGSVAGSSSHDAAQLAAAAASSTQQQRRQRTLTLPGKRPTAPVFNPDDLARKLQNVQMAEVSSPTFQQQHLPLLQPQQQLQQLTRSSSNLRSKSISRTSGDHQRQQVPSPAMNPVSPTSMSSPALRSRSIKEPSPILRQPSSVSPTAAGHAPPVPTLRPMRSFHRPAGRPVGMDDHRSVPLPFEADQRLDRSSTTSANRSSREGHLHRSASRSRVSGEPLDRPTIPDERVPPLPANLSGRTSTDEPRKLVKSPPSPEARLLSVRTSADVERPRTSGSQHQPAGLGNKVLVSQQRIFVVNQQQFHMVEIGPSTTAGDIIALMDAQGALTGWAGSGGWMVFEIAQDFGMERPIRSYELLVDVQSSWLKDKTVNYFVLKLTPLAVPLSRSAIPSSSPTHSGYVEWEVKRGKWSKRWLQLREHSLWLSKRDNRKDEVLLCSLSNFDAYQITRNHRAPKPFAFAVKSTDNLSYFEDTADYLHNFSCSEKDGLIWTEKILVARSYVLHQERHVLFSPKPTSGNASTGATLSRSGTKKHAAPRPAQTLVTLPPLLTAQSLPNQDVFEPGSLLAKQL